MYLLFMNLLHSDRQNARKEIKNKHVGYLNYYSSAICEKSNARVLGRPLPTKAAEKIKPFIH